MQKERFDIIGMTCSACSSRIEKAISALHGVNGVSVNLLKNSMNVSFDESSLSESDIVTAVEKVGYGATWHGGSQKNRKEENTQPDTVKQEFLEMKQRLIISFLFTIPLFYISMGHMLGLALPGFLLGTENAINFAFTQFLLTLPVIFVNRKYYHIGFKALFSGAPNMDSLIAMGSAAATLFGVYAIFKIGTALGHADTQTVNRFAMNLYFESAAMILTLITLGKFVEAKAKGKTSDAITKLMNLSPQTATRLKDGIETVVPIDAVRVDDILVVKAGESLPVDGIILEGSGFFDESALTGESVAVEKQGSDPLTGATIMVSGHMVMQATRVGDDTTLAEIIRLMDEATSSKAPIAKLVDKVSGVFVPIVIAIAVIATVIWLWVGYDIEFALSIGISVLVISCPCALGLATPTAIMVGTGQGALHGILIKSAEAFETAGAIDTVVLDKTGTITEGKPVVTNMVLAASFDESTLLTQAASLEKLSEHPLGRAIVQEAEKRGIALNKVAHFKQIPGQGIMGKIAEDDYLVGNHQMLVAENIEPQTHMQETANRLANEGKTVLFVVQNKTLVGIIAVADVIKPNSPQAVSEFRAMNIDALMLTGDNAKTATFIQHKVGIDRVVAEVLPQDKEQKIRLLQGEGKKVAMVGDGINDAPALARADVGIAIGAGTDIAIESADIVLMKSELLDAVTAIELSRAVMRNIRQNLFWAFIYNMIGIPIAAGVFYGVWGLTLNPMIAAAAMSFSSVSVVTNALRLKFFKPKRYPKTDSKTSGFAEKPIHTTTTLSRSKKMTVEKIINIDGMTCDHCKNAVEKALNDTPGVIRATVNLEEKTAIVQAQDDVSNEVLRDAVTNARYQVLFIS